MLNYLKYNKSFNTTTEKKLNVMNGKVVSLEEYKQTMSLE